MPTLISDPAGRAEFARQHALTLGFDAVGIARADEAWAASERLEAFVEAGHHGTMEWMETTLERRRTPVSMWAGAKSAITVALNYGPDHDPMETLQQRECGNISVYARGRDYHDTLKSRLKQLAREFVAKTGAEVKVFVDTAPLMEKPLAAKAGLGWQGKHTNLVSRELGSWFFLGVMLTDAELPPIRRRQTIAAAAGTVSTSARPRLSRRHTSSMRGGAFRTSPSSTRARSRKSSARRWATGYMAAMTVSPSARGTSSPAQPAKRPSMRGPS
jgi:hypothetical protein